MLSDRILEIAEKFIYDSLLGSAPVRLAASPDYKSFSSRISDKQHNENIPRMAVPGPVDIDNQSCD
jgi:hypothetical protein